MKAIILAAGISSRLGSLTLNYPKCLLEIGNNAIIEHQLNWIEFCGIESTIVVTGYKEEMIRNRLKNRVSYIHFPEFAKYNNLYTLHYIISELNDDILLLFSDVLISRKLLRKCVQSDGDFSLIVDKNNISDTTMRVKTSDQFVIEIGSHIPVEEGDGNFVGIAKYSRIGLKKMIPVMEELVVSGTHLQDYYTQSLNPLAKKEERINMVQVNDEPWLEIDFKEDYTKAVALGMERYYSN